MSLYYMPRNGVPYADLGPAPFAPRDDARVRRRALAQLEHQGYQVTLMRPVA